MSKKNTKDIKKSKDTEDDKNIKNDVESVSSKKVVYIDIDDELTIIYEKIKNVSCKHVYIVVPQKAVLFQSVINLKILKKKALDSNKKIYLVTNDKTGIHLAEKTGITVYNKANSEGKPAIVSSDSNDERLRITPLRASVNAVEEEAPTRITERKLSISDILRKQNEKKSKKTINTEKTKINKKNKFSKKNKLVIINPNRHALIALIALSSIILLFIIYIALPGATIYITPSSTKLEKDVNITLADYQKNMHEIDTAVSDHMIASYPISTNISDTITYTATGKRSSENAENASGLLTIYNITNLDWPLITETRFQNEEGIIFRIKDAIVVPAGSSETPGQIEAFVVADQFDANNLVVGERGNIEASKFFLPGLREESRTEIYAESFAPMSGGFSDYITYITDEDLLAARMTIENHLKDKAITELKQAVDEKNSILGENEKFKLLEGKEGGKDSVEISNVNIVLDDSIVGQEIDSFEVSGDVNVSGIYYSEADMLKILTEELFSIKTSNKELVIVDEKSTTYVIFEWDDASGKVKLTAGIKGVEQYEINPNTESGQKLLEKIKEHISGKKIEDATLFIQNLPEVNKVNIESWPAWSPTIPSIPDNIEFEIK